jgi:iron(III) transport system substrate-binding protein
VEVIAMAGRGQKMTRRTLLGYMAISAGGLVVACGPGGTALPSATTAATPSAAAARWGMTAAQETAWKQIEEAAKKEGRVTYYSVGSVPAARVEDLKAAWRKDYPDIEIDYLAVGNNAAIVARVTTEQESKTYAGDAVDFSLGNVLRVSPAFFEDFTAPASKDPTAKWSFEPVTAVQSKPVFQAMMAQYFGFWINTTKVKLADAPQNYLDLTNPKWKDQIVYRQPWTTGGGNHSYVFATKTYPDVWVKGMQAQNLTFAADQDAALLQVARGEFAIGIGLTGRQGGEFIKQGLPLAVVWPEDIAIRVSNGIVVLNKAPHVNAAKVFANWMITQRGQELWRDLGQFPINLNVPPGEEFMKGFSRSKTNNENLLAETDLQASLKKAESEFKK